MLKFLSQVSMFTPLKIKPIHKGFVVVILGLALLTSSFLVPYHSFLPAWDYQDDTYIINSGGRSSFSTSLGPGGFVQVMLFIVGDEYVHFQVEDRGGEAVVDETLIPGRYFFQFQPGVSNTFDFFLENSGSLTQSVYWIVWVYYYTTAFQLLGTILSAIGSYLVASAIVKKREALIGQIMIERKDSATIIRQRPSGDLVQQAQRVLKELKNKKARYAKDD
jgi:hypothetical protein